MTDGAMFGTDLSARSSELRVKRVPFVHARVVLAEAPTSAKPGDQAIVGPDGAIEGFVGGSCAESTVRDQALALLATGGTAVVRITPVAEKAQPPKVVVHNPCLSGGTLEVFLEVVTPPPLVLVVGKAPIAAALLALGGPLGYDVRTATGRLPPDTSAVVVATHGGAGEAEALTAALEGRVPYVGLVASRRRGKAVVESLPVDESLKSLVHTPAGLDIGAATAPEIALSILAEVVATGAGAGRPRPVPTLATETAVDPVCGMHVAPGDGVFHAEHQGRTVWFCGRGCLEAFLADPTFYPAR